MYDEIHLGIKIPRKMKKEIKKLKNLPMYMAYYIKYKNKVYYVSYFFNKLMIANFYKDEIITTKINRFMLL